LDRAQIGYYRLHAYNVYLEKKRTEFQNWFVDLMNRRYPKSFIKVRLTEGDGKLDGYRLGDSTVFAVYAPRENTRKISETIKKIQSDFDGAKNTLSEDGLELTKWIFVSNDQDGIPKEITTQIARIENEHSNCVVEYWDFEAIWNEIKELDEIHLIELFGNAPSITQIDSLQFQSLHAVISFIQGQPVPLNPPLDPPDVNKLEYNSLSDVIMDYLRVGRRKEKLVDQYFDLNQKLNLGEKIAQAFRKKYATLKNSKIDLSADTIFQELWNFAGGGQLKSLENSAAVLAILSYFFESCDIFENPPQS